MRKPTIKYIGKQLQEYVTKTKMENWSFDVSSDIEKEGALGESCVDYFQQHGKIRFNLNSPEHRDPEELTDTIAHEIEHHRIGGLRLVFEDIISSYVPAQEQEAVRRQYMIQDEMLVSHLARTHLDLMGKNSWTGVRITEIQKGAIPLGKQNRKPKV
jgi:hypothetical protein